MFHRRCHHLPGAEWRFIMARFRRDPFAEHFLTQQLSTCAACWAATASRLADIVIEELHDQLANPTLGWTEDQVLDMVADCIARELDNAEDAA
jgi:hypothetical protein